MSPKLEAVALLICLHLWGVRSWKEHHFDCATRLLYQRGNKKGGGREGEKNKFLMFL